MSAKPILTVGFVIYLAFVIYLTQFIYLIPGPPSSESPKNLVPLRTIRQDLRRGGPPFVVNFLGNLALLGPLGFLTPWLRRSRTSAGSIALLSLGCSVLIEGMQFGSGRRVADVDDVILNVLGGLLGFLAFRVLIWASGGRLAPVLGPDRLPPSPRRRGLSAREGPVSIQSGGGTRNQVVPLKGRDALRGPAEEARPRPDPEG